MKNLIHKSLLLIAAVSAMVSCLPEREFMYTDTGMCSVIGHNRLKTDGGSIYNIAENPSQLAIADSLKRVMISCDVMSEIQGRPNEFNIRLLDFMAAIYNEPVAASAMDEEAIGNDGVNVTQGWVSGGYLNAYINLAMQRNSDVEHDINLVFDDLRSDADTLRFSVRHNAHGDSPENEEIDLGRFAVAGAYVSFPLDGILPAGGKSPVVHLEWEWYNGTEGAVGSREKTAKSGNLVIQ